MEYECEICGRCVSSDVINDEEGLRYCKICEDMREQESQAEQFHEQEMWENMTREERMHF